MLKNTFLTAALLVTGSISTLLVPLSANALTTTYTNQATFLSNTSSTYLENFNSLTSGASQTSPKVFSSGSFSYSVAAGSGTLYSGTGNTGSVFLGENTGNQPITITFTSGNVTAVGGQFFLVSNFDSLKAGLVNLTLNDGSTVNLTSPTSAPTPFGGFTTNGPLITSLTFAAPGSGNFAAFDNFYVGLATVVPFEFSPTLGLGILSGAWLVRKSLKKKLTKG